MTRAQTYMRDDGTIAIDRVPIAWKHIILWADRHYTEAGPDRGDVWVPTEKAYAEYRREHPYDSPSLRVFGMAFGLALQGTPRTTRRINGRLQRGYIGIDGPGVVVR